MFDEVEKTQEEIKDEKEEKEEAEFIELLDQFLTKLGEEREKLYQDVLARGELPEMPEGTKERFFQIVDNFHFPGLIGNNPEDGDPNCSQ